jgi:transcription elongation factor GreB
MSKAFTREDDESETEIVIPRIPLPDGLPNYLTSDGAARLTARLAQLEEERRRLTTDGGDDLGSDQLRRNNAHRQALSRVLSSAIVTPPPETSTTEIRFGAFVTILDELGTEQEYRIVGVDEIDLDKGWISWLSPIARTLIGRTTGDTVQFETAGGKRKLTILNVRYADTSRPE